MKLNLLIISCLLMSVHCVALKNLEFETLNSNNGMSSEEIRDIYQDKNGYLWFLTKEGLNRYDGHEIKLYKPGNENINFPTASFECVCEDKLNRLWLGTSENGVLIFDQNNHDVISFEEFSGGKELQNQHIRSLLTDSNGDIWIGTEFGLYKYYMASGQLDFYNLGNLDLQEPFWCIIEDLLEDVHGNIWVATGSQGLYIFDKSKDEFFNYLDFDAKDARFNANRIKTIYEDRNHIMWIGTWEDGLFRVSYREGELFIDGIFLYDDNNEQTISSDIIYSINQDLSDDLWIGTPYGLTIIENPYNELPTFHRFTYNYNSLKGLSNNEVWKIFQDKSGLMWIGTLGGGINKVHPEGQFFDGYDIPPVSAQIQSQTVKSFCVDPEQNLLIGVKSLGFGIYNFKTRKYLPYTGLDSYQTLPGNINTVNCFYNENNRYLWLGTRYNGLLVHDYETKENIFINEYSEQFAYESVNAIHYDKRDLFWVATDDGLYYVKRCDSSNICYEVNRIEGLNGDRFVTIMEDHLRNIWVGTAENGISKINWQGDGLYLIQSFSRSKDNAPTNAIQYLYQDSKNRIWAGSSDKSLLRYNADVNKFLQVDILKDSKTDAIFCIIEDENHKLWLTTNNGLTRLIGEDEKLVADNFTIADGLQGNIFVPGSIYNHNNRIYVGCYFGFNTFLPSEIKSNDYLPQTSITEILINNSPHVYDYRTSDPIILEYDQNNLVLRFSAMSFYKPEKNLFSYILEGYDKSWQYTDAYQKGAQYSNLNAGSYTLLVKSANSSGLWNSDPIKLTFDIRPAPWYSWWAYSLYGLVSLFLLAATYRFIMSNEKLKRQLEIQKIEHAKTKKLNQFKLSFFTNISHELLTPLSVMSCAIEIIRNKSRKNRGELGILERNMQNLNSLLQQLLDFRKMEEGHVELQVQKRSFQPFVSDIAINFKPLADKKNISLLVSDDENTREFEGFFDDDKMEKILRNIVSNAIKYTPDGGLILVNSEVQQKETGAWANISIRDTGIGISEENRAKIFHRFYKADLEQEDTGFGIGLAVVKRLVEVHKGNIEVSSTLNKGTTFHLSIPLSEKVYSEKEKSSFQIGSDGLEENTEPEIKIIAQSPDKTISSAKVNMLVVDNNPDFRNVLKTYFSDLFVVEEAEDGVEALEKAITLQPDIIVSDVLMPNMNGYDLCQALKNTLDTKYIPVVLLTTKNATEEQSMGYKAGADSYITKPVSLKLLESRINALLIKRHEFMPFQKIDILPNVKSPKLTPQEFLSKVEDIIEEFLDDPEFSVKDLNRHLGMSDSMLYRKVKQITNLSPVELIKKIRLNSAASMLKKGRYNVSEVAFETGFSDQSYFTQCFKKKFGLTPTEYVKFNSQRKTAPALRK